MATFHDAIARNQWQTLFLILLLPTAFMAVFWGIFTFFETDPIMVENLLLAVGALAFVWMWIAYRWGDQMMLGSAEAKPITRRDNPTLYRLTDNLAITAGLPKTPDIYIIQDESMNAFATGRSPETSSIAVTSGLLNRLEKSELEAVLAHEMAHILHRDVRLMMLVITGIGFFTFMSEVLFRVLRRVKVKSSNNKKGDATAFIFLLALSFFIFGYLVAPLVRFALSRRREYQADAGSVKLTRNPQAMIRALRIIETDPRVEVLDKKQMMASVCIANPLAKTTSLFSRLAGLYRTHPPIDDRVKAIEMMDK
ncbi:MAG: M48 family metallopeptidase [Alphaproteobacteria bacterium]|nr:M48 family metallopeptidase [Alphaproteobacteria bacterium]MBN2779720.1 M48 family metallopeptidase [Alphaproteobacteria bacterium]